MKRTNIALLLIPTLALLAGAAIAQDDEGDLEGTIRLMGRAEAATSESVTKEITLPAQASIKALPLGEPGAKGQEKANDARQGRENGQEIANEAREHAAANARDNVSDMAEAARENAENRSRADEFRPERPDRPDTPNPPNQ